jgi:hypothetical protein
MDDLFPRSYSFLAPEPSYPWENDLFGPVDTEGEPLFANPPAAPPLIVAPPPHLDAAAIGAAIAAGGAPAVGGAPVAAPVIAPVIAPVVAHAPAAIDIAPFADVLRVALNDLIVQFRGMTAGSQLQLQDVTLRL